LAVTIAPTHDKFRVLSRLPGLPKGNVAAFEGAQPLTAKVIWRIEMERAEIVELFYAALIGATMANSYFGSFP
jgi:hypothetical protein